MASAPRDDHWHLDKKVPLAIIGAILMQTGCALWFVSKLESRVERLERQEIEQRERDNGQDKANSDAAASWGARLERMESKLDRLIEWRFGSGDKR